MDPEPSEEQRGFFEEIDSAEVVVVILAALGQCLVLDSRYTTEDPPEMSVSPPLGSGERRLHELNQARPHLPKAQRLVGVPWGGSLNALVRSGVGERPVPIGEMERATPQLLGHTEKILGQPFVAGNRESNAGQPGFGVFRVLQPGEGLEWVERPG